MCQVLDLVRRLAASEVRTVLLQGETGVGKDVVANYLHQCGPRREMRFVALNCAAIPETLCESELFGHERGAFTDARTAKSGLLEATDHGTLFLDEIGQIAPWLQGKFGWRVLEGGVFAADRRPVGSSRGSAFYRRDQPGSGGSRGSRRVSHGPVLPPQRFRNHHSSAAREARGYSAVGPTFIGFSTGSSSATSRGCRKKPLPH